MSNYLSSAQALEELSRIESPLREGINSGLKAIASGAYVIGFGGFCLKKHIDLFIGDPQTVAEWGGGGAIGVGGAYSLGLITAVPSLWWFLNNSTNAVVQLAKLAGLHGEGMHYLNSPKRGIRPHKPFITAKPAFHEKEHPVNPVETIGDLTNNQGHLVFANGVVIEEIIQQEDPWDSIVVGSLTSERMVARPGRQIEGDPMIGSIDNERTSQRYLEQFLNQETGAPTFMFGKVIEDNHLNVFHFGPAMTN